MIKEKDLKNLKIYKATVYKAHVPIGNLTRIDVYLFAKDLLEAENLIYNTVRGWKRSYGILNFDAVFLNKDLDYLMTKILKAGFTLNKVLKTKYFVDKNY